MTVTPQLKLILAFLAPMFKAYMNKGKYPTLEGHKDTPYGSVLIIQDLLPPSHCVGQIVVFARKGLRATRAPHLIEWSKMRSYRNSVATPDMYTTCRRSKDRRYSQSVVRMEIGKSNDGVPIRLFAYSVVDTGAPEKEVSSEPVVVKQKDEVVEEKADIDADVESDDMDFSLDIDFDFMATVTSAKDKIATLVVPSADSTHEIVADIQSMFTVATPPADMVIGTPTSTDAPVWMQYLNQ